MSLFDLMQLRLFIAFWVMCMVSACVKEPSYPIIPAIEFKSVSSDFIYSGSVDTITFSFTDGDGDIGVRQSDGDSCNPCGLKDGDSSCLRMSGFNVFLIDNRDNCVGTFASANVEPDGNLKAIAGEIEVIRAIDSKKCLIVPDPLCPLDTVVYTIILRDKAGNFSNAIRTSPIYVSGQ